MNIGEDHKSLEQRVEEELADSVDEELEQELGDDMLARLPQQVGAIDHSQAIDRKTYFTELLRLQRELIKLQDWVVAHKLKLVVLFEGRDAAGKGGVIKRVMQRLNPRVCRTVALPAPTERERSQWYFQRYAAHLPAAGRSCCSIAAGTTAPASNESWASARLRRSRSSSAPCRSSSACWCARASCW